MNHGGGYPGPKYTITVANLPDELIRDQAQVIMAQASWLIWQLLCAEEYVKPA